MSKMTNAIQFRLAKVTEKFIAFISSGLFNLFAFIAAILILKSKTDETIYKTKYARMEEK